MKGPDLRPAAALVLLLAAAAGCASGASPSPAAGPTPSLEPIPQGITAASPDGRYHLLIKETRLVQPLRDPRMRVLFFWGLLEPADPGVLIACEIPERRVLLSDGREQSQDVESKGLHSPWGVTSAERSIGGFLDVGDEPSRLASLAFELPVLRVRSWETFAATIASGDRTATLEASPFRIRVEPGPQVCRMTTSGGTPGLLDTSWAVDATEVVDSGGVRLTILRGSGDGHSFAGYLACPRTEGRDSFRIAYPLAVRLRVPKEYDLERIPFEFRDLPLPPLAERPGAENGAKATLRSAWSEHHDGVAIRLSLPDRVLRGGVVEASVGASLDLGESPRDAFTIEELDLVHRMHLVFRNPGSGATLELPPWEPPEGEAREPSAAGSEVGEFPVRFPLAPVWDALVPGAWEVRACLEVPPNPDNPGAWSGTYSTAPLPFAVEEPPASDLRRMRLIVPAALHLHAGEEPGTVDIGFGPADAEVVEFEFRNGFELCVAWGLEDGTSMSSQGFPEIPEVVDTLYPDDSGPLDRIYQVMVFEALPWEYAREGAEGGVHPTLWKKSFRVSATAAEIEALRR